MSSLFLVTCLFWLVAHARAFAAGPWKPLGSIVPAEDRRRDRGLFYPADPRTMTHQRYMSLNENDTNDNDESAFSLGRKNLDDQGIDWIQQTKFNPFDYQNQRGSSTASTPFAATTQPISYRRIQMRRIFNEMLDAAGAYSLQRSKSANSDDDDDDEANPLISILLDHENVIMGPLEEEDVVLDDDSVIRPGMPRSERYRVYLESLESRILAAKSQQVRMVLKAIHDFVQERQ